MSPPHRDIGHFNVVGAVADPELQVVALVDSLNSKAKTILIHLTGY